MPLQDSLSQLEVVVSSEQFTWIDAPRAAPLIRLPLAVFHSLVPLVLWLPLVTTLSLLSVAVAPLVSTLSSNE